MGKACILCIIILLLLSMVYINASAEGPIDPFFAVSQPIKRRLTIRSPSSEITLPEKINTGTPCTFSINVPAAKYYFSILSPIEASSNIYEYNYLDHFGNRSNTFSYTFYFPGNYWLRVQVEDENQVISVKEAFFEVQGENILEQKIQEIVSSCPYAGEYEKALWFHDYLIKHAYYDTDLSRYYADGVLMDGLGVCDSYSKAYDLLLKEANILSQRIVSETHAWNAVYMEDDWYNIDTTWDDPGISNEQISGHESHKYFGLPNDIMFKIDNHFPESDYPDCHSISCNYAVRENRMPWHDAILASIVDKLNDYENVFLLELERQYPVDESTSVEISEPIIPYGLSAHLLESKGMIYRSHNMTIEVEKENIDQFLLNIEVHYLIPYQEEQLLLCTSIIRDEAFIGCGATAIVINDTCSSIGRFAFSNMERLKYIVFSNNEISIESDACYGCDPNIIVLTAKDSPAIEFAKANGYCLEITE